MRKEGVLGLYKGFLPTLLRDVPEIALQVDSHVGLHVIRMQCSCHVSHMVSCRPTCNPCAPENSLIWSFSGSAQIELTTLQRAFALLNIH